MKVRHYLRRAFSMSPAQLARKVIQRSGDVIRQKRQVRQEKRQPSFVVSYKGSNEGLYRYIRQCPSEHISLDPKQILELSKRNLEHRFDLLGSGWVQVKPGMACKGLEGNRYQADCPVLHDGEGRWIRSSINAPNQAEALRIWKLIKEPYEAIDWQIDFKSGFRWKENEPSRQLVYAHKPGVDVKVPWELARMQHLSQFVWAYLQANSKHPDFETPECYATEFRNEILDFIASNPPRFGANWKCAMDVGIRAVNWLITYDLFRAAGFDFDAEFSKLLERSVYEHGRFLIENLEYDPVWRANHYLADVTSLFIISAYLPRSSETDSWLAFGLQETIVEAGRQFQSDGFNFEASTCYHRLSAEMVLYAVSYALGLPPEKQDALQDYDHRSLKTPAPLKPAPLAFHAYPDVTGKVPVPPWLNMRLKKMVSVSSALRKPNGLVPQFGDNDSGRFLKLFPVYCRSNESGALERIKQKSDLAPSGSLGDSGYWKEQHLDQGHLEKAYSGFANPTVDGVMPAELNNEGWVVQQIAGGWGCKFDALTGQDQVNECRVGTEEDKAKVLQQLRALPEGRCYSYRIPVEDDGYRLGIKAYSIGGNGFYLLKGKHLYLLIRCGPLGQGGFGGHDHNDQLGIEVMVGGQEWVLDPGSYLYTPLPERRNEYRSVTAHFAPQIEGREPAGLEKGLFALEGDPTAECLYFANSGFVGRHSGYGKPVYRAILLEADGIKIIDGSDGAPLVRLCEAEFKEPWSRLAYSEGYGLKSNASNSTQH